MTSPSEPERERCEAEFGYCESCGRRKTRDYDEYYRNSSGDGVCYAAWAKGDNEMQAFGNCQYWRARKAEDALEAAHATITRLESSLASVTGELTRAESIVMSVCARLQKELAGDIDAMGAAIHESIDELEARHSQAVASAALATEMRNAAQAEVAKAKPAAEFIREHGRLLLRCVASKWASCGAEPAPRKLRECNGQLILLISEFCEPSTLVAEEAKDSTLPDPSSGVLGEATPEEPDA